MMSSEPLPRPAPGARSAPPGSAASDALERLVEDALAQLQQASTGPSLCEAGRSRTPVPSAKFAEGRLAALRQVRRLAGDAGPAASIEQVRAEWSADLARRRESGAGPDWIAYREGGLAGLAGTGGGSDDGTRPAAALRGWEDEA
ncbi:MAG: hypothetical protein HZB48_05210 [Actinobacteria bacterium]|nr:hypothetical protein [Actinomycetota bacterium]